MVSTEKHPILEVIIVTQYEEVVQNLESFVTEISCEVAPGRRAH